MMSKRALVRVAAVVFALALMACTQAESTPATPNEGAGSPQRLTQLPVLQPVPAPPKASTTERTFRHLRTSPEKGTIGTPFTLSGEGFRPGQEVELQWATWDGSYATKPSAETVAYESRKLVDQRLLLGRVKADVHGVITGSYVSPEDFGELHEIYAITDGAEVARGGFRILMDASIDPSEGGVGTPVTVTVTGMAAKLFSGATMALRFDNAYTGILTATITHGTARAEFRAAGAVGPHVVMVNAGSVPAYLNIAQSPYAPWMWVAAWHIPTDYALGEVDYSVLVTARQLTGPSSSESSPWFRPSHLSGPVPVRAPGPDTPE